MPANMCFGRIMLSLSRVTRPLTGMAAAAAVVLVAACDTDRERPTGPNSALTTVAVEVAHPGPNGVVPSDSTTVVVIRATGLVSAIGYSLLTNSTHEEISRAREALEQPVTEVVADFTVQIPDFPTGTHLEVYGVAEDAVGGSHFTGPTFVIVVECDRFELACG